MTREHDFDHVLKHWLDDGAEVAPERFVWAALEDVERTAQRGAWRATLEGFLMSLKPVAPFLGVAAIAVAALALYVALANPNIGTPQPTPRTFTPEELSEIILTDTNALEGLEADVGSRQTGVAALVSPLRPGGETIDTTRFVDALRIDWTGSTGGFTTWAALFDSPEATAQAFDFLVIEHESAEGWGLAGTREDPELGEEGAIWTGQQYDMLAARTIMWRQGNLILAAVGWADWDPEEVSMIAQQMDDRTH